jgi:hypothetical protein
MGWLTNQCKSFVAQRISLCSFEFDELNVACCRFKNTSREACSSTMHEVSTKASALSGGNVIYEARELFLKTKAYEEEEKKHCRSRIQL